VERPADPVVPGAAAARMLVNPTGDPLEFTLPAAKRVVLNTTAIEPQRDHTIDSVPAVSAHGLSPVGARR
jgi:hypothetical protein